jgi:hypothetical protein
MFNSLRNRFVNSWVWFHIYYKHTKEHKQNIADTIARVMKVKRKCKNEKTN